MANDSSIKVADLRAVRGYDAIVIGVGGVGSSALYHLAKRGLHALAIDQFSLGHRRGSSHGQTRIIRQAYFEHPDYVPLLRSAYRLWHELETDIGQQLFNPVGLVEVGPPDGVVISGVRRSANEHNLIVDEISAADYKQRFPQLTIPPDHDAILEPTAGFLQVEQCVLTHIDRACLLGGEVRSNESVIGWESNVGGYRVHTTRAQYQTERIVVCGGAWTSRLLNDLDVPLEVIRKHTYWFGDRHPAYQVGSGFPSFFFETDAGYFYGMPATGRLGVKIARHSGGARVSDADTDHRNNSRDVDEFRKVASFADASMPALDQSAVMQEACYYTMTPDEHFLIDKHPRQEGVVIIGGLSGHGFKFTSVLGQIAADLVVDGSTAHPIDLFRLSRLAADSHGRQQS